MNPDNDRLRLRDPDVLANRFGYIGPNDEPARLPAIRFEVTGARRFRITPAHVLLFGLALAIVALVERLAHPLHLT